MWNSQDLLDFRVPPRILPIKLAPAPESAEPCEDKPLWIEPDRRAWTAAFPAYLSDERRRRLDKTKEMDSPTVVGVRLYPVEKSHIARFSEFAANSETMALNDEPVGLGRRDLPLDRLR